MIWLIVCILTAAVTGAIFRAWSMLLRIRSLERDTAKLFDFLQADRARQAAAKRWTKPEIQQELSQLKQVQPATDGDPWYWKAGR